MNVNDPPARILIVEDEPKLAAVLADYLHVDGFATTLLADGRDVIAHVRHQPPDLMLLDLMLPGRSGIDICRDLRQFSALPVIILTARVDEIDRLLGLELGADDYVCKPFSPREVVARVKAILRRTASVAAAVPPLTAASAGRSGSLPAAAPPPAVTPTAPGATGLWLDEAAYSARLDGVALRLTPVELRLLALLARSPGRIFQREYLLGHLYDDRRVVTDRTIDSHVKNLRRKLQTLRPGSDPIASVYGVGYRLDL
ncbi:MAG: response regulator [Janthinobacterium lividum]